MALVAIGIEGAMLIALVTLFNYVYRDVDVIKIKEGGEEE